METNILGSLETWMNSFLDGSSEGHLGTSGTSTNDTNARRDIATENVPIPNQPVLPGGYIDDRGQINHFYRPWGNDASSSAKTSVVSGDQSQPARVVVRRVEPDIFGLGNDAFAVRCSHDEQISGFNIEPQTEFTRRESLGGRSIHPQDYGVSSEPAFSSIDEPNNVTGDDRTPPARVVTREEPDNFAIDNRGFAVRCSSNEQITDVRVVSQTNGTHQESSGVWPVHSLDHRRLYEPIRSSNVEPISVIGDDRITPARVVVKSEKPDIFGFDNRALAVRCSPDELISDTNIELQTADPQIDSTGVRPMHSLDLGESCMRGTDEPISVSRDEGIPLARIEEDNVGNDNFVSVVQSSNEEDIIDINELETKVATKENLNFSPVSSRDHAESCRVVPGSDDHDVKKAQTVHLTFKTETSNRNILRRALRREEESRRLTTDGAQVKQETPPEEVPADIFGEEEEDDDLIKLCFEVEEILSETREVQPIVDGNSPSTEASDDSDDEDYVPSSSPSESGDDVQPETSLELDENPRIRLGREDNHCSEEYQQAREQEHHGQFMSALSKKALEAGRRLKIHLKKIGTGTRHTVSSTETDGTSSQKTQDTTVEPTRAGFPDTTDLRSEYQEREPEHNEPFMSALCKKALEAGRRLKIHLKEIDIVTRHTVLSTETEGTSSQKTQDNTVEPTRAGFPDNTDLRSDHEDDERQPCGDFEDRLSKASDTSQRRANVNTERVDVEEKTYGCHYCGKTFRTRTSASNHEKEHSGEEPFICQLCSKLFREQSLLEEHTKSHGHEELCAQVFSSKRDVAAEEQHSGKTFSQNESGEDHEALHTESKNRRTQQNNQNNVDPVRETMKCQFCQKICKCKSALQIHERTHTKEKPFSCQFCEKKCSTKREVKVHERVHTKEKPYKCQYCGKQFTRDETRKSHEAIHTDEKNFKCRYCDHRFRGRGHRYNHERKVHSGKDLFKCQYCPRICCNKSTLAIHERTHTKEKPFSCQFCEKKFSSKGEVKIHERVHTKEKPYKCQYCGKPFARDETRKSHEAIHTDEKNFKCRYCDQRFRGRGHRYNHERKVHSGKDPLKCQYCQKSFYNKSLLEIHIRTHTNEKPYLCQFCHKRFPTKGQMIIHERVHTKERPYQCQYCGKQFTRDETRKSHEAIHTDEKNFKCRYCDKLFRSSGERYNHEKKVHSGEDPLRCQYCQKGCYNRSSLVAHERTHTKEKSFSCNICDMAFWTQRQLGFHELVHSKEKHCNDVDSDNQCTQNEKCHGETHTSEENMKCRYCNEYFDDEQNRHQHEMELHSRKDPLQCQFCPRTFLSRYRVTVHERIHTKENPYPCQFCEEKFSTLQEALVHERVHTRIQLYKCQYCGKQFTRNENLKLHESIHTGNMRIKCRYCDKYFTGMESRCNHEKNLHSGEELKDGPFPCKICEETFWTKRQLYVHGRVHPELRRFKCQYCDEHFTRNEKRKAHEAIHTGEKNVKCRYCDEKFRGLPERYQHEKRKHTRNESLKCQYCHNTYKNRYLLKVHESHHTAETPFSCQFCEKKFTTKRRLEIHERVHSDEKPYKCQYCDRQFKRSGSHKAHEAKHTGEKNVKCRHCDELFWGTASRHYHEKKIHSSEKDLFKCQYCPRTCYNKGILEIHERTHTKEKPFSCQFCEKKFASKGEVKIHERVHTKERPYKCQYCGKQFTRDETRKSHEAIHTDEKNFKCRHCDKLFRSSGERYYHEKKVHSGKDPLRCQYCQKVFYRRCDLEPHERTHTKEKSFPCNACDKTFWNQKQLDFHELVHSKVKYCKDASKDVTTDLVQ